MRPVALAGLLLVTASLAAQTPPPLKLSGWAEASYIYSRHSAGDTIIVGRLYDRLQNRFTLNAFGVVLDKPYDPAKRSAGFHTEVLFGQNADRKSTRLNSSHLVISYAVFCLKKKKICGYMIAP